MQYGTENENDGKYRIAIQKNEETKNEILLVKIRKWRNQTFIKAKRVPISVRRFKVWDKKAK